VTSTYEPGFDPIYDPDTPPGAERKLERFQAALEQARRELEQARDTEVDAKAARDDARRRAQFSPDCPKVGVFGGVRTTVAYQKAWIEERAQDEERAYQLAKAARQAAAERLHTLGKQGNYQQSITSSVRESYRSAGRPQW